MTTFDDGPAKGRTLSLRRAPWLLRVVRSKAGEWDALDQLDDTPKRGETIHVYRRVTEVNRYHLKASGKMKAASGFYEGAAYKALPIQPKPEEVWETEAWRTWCTTKGKKVLAALQRGDLKAVDA